MKSTSCTATLRATGERMAKTRSRDPRSWACSRFEAGAVSWYAVLAFCPSFSEIARPLFSWPIRPVSGTSSSNWNLYLKILPNKWFNPLFNFFFKLWFALLLDLCFVCLCLFACMFDFYEKPELHFAAASGLWSIGVPDEQPVPLWFGTI